jgi:hypothetical protein
MAKPLVQARRRAGAHTVPLPLAPRRNVAWQGLQLRAQTPGATRAHGHRDKLTHYSLFVFLEENSFQSL